MFDRSGNRKYLNWPERKALLQVFAREAEPLKKSFCLTLFFTGCRISEALQCTWGRVDLSGRAIVFETLKRRQRGNFRSVPIPPPLLHALEGLKASAGSDGRVWPVSRVTAYRWIKRKMIEAAMTGSKASPKGLRHSHAVACVSRNIPLTVVKKWLGHARLETTAIYLEVANEEERELAERVWRMNRQRRPASLFA